MLQAIYRFRHKADISLEEAMNLDDDVKTDLIRNDPVMCARYFSHKAEKFMSCLKRANSIFDEFTVIDSYERVEFQMRGSPHEHIFLWLKDAPIYDPENPDSEKQCCDFIDRFITCEFDANNPYIVKQLHKHIFTCHKYASSKESNDVSKKQSKRRRKCRFNIPLPVMRRTRFLHPIENIDEKEHKKAKENYKKVQACMEELYTNPVRKSFDEILNELQLDESEYILAIRTSIRKPKYFLRRDSMSVGINAYNKDILLCFEANVDMQFILDVYAVASYMINYITKAEAGMSKMIRQAVADCKAGNRTIKERLRTISNVFINGTLLSAQEAAYISLSMPLSISSRVVVFINTGPAESRHRILKKVEELKKLNPVVDPNVFEKYAMRNLNEYKGLCLADYVAQYNEHFDKSRWQSSPKERRKCCSVFCTSSDSRGRIVGKLGTAQRKTATNRHAYVEMGERETG